MILHPVSQGSAWHGRTTRNLYATENGRVHVGQYAGDPCWYVVWLWEPTRGPLNLFNEQGYMWGTTICEAARAAPPAVSAHLGIIL